MTEETLLDAIDKMERAVDHVQGQFTASRQAHAAPELIVDPHGGARAVGAMTVRRRHGGA